MNPIIVKMDGADAVRQRLAEIAGRAGNMSPIMKAIGDRVVEQTKRRFESGGPAPDGTPWKPPKTKNPKRRGTLRVSDQLRDSIRFQLLGRNAVAIGTNKIYGPIHQFGGTITQGSRSELFIRNRYARGAKKGQFKKGTKDGQGFTFGNRRLVIPARPFLGLSAGNSAEIIGLINEYLAGR